MKSLNGELDIELFSQLIETILYCHFSRKKNIGQQILQSIKRLQTASTGDGLNLNSGIKIISKLHEGSDFKISSVLEKHFLEHYCDKYCIFLEIFALQNKRQQQYFTGKYQKNRLLQKWVFSKYKGLTSRDSPSQLNKTQSDLFLKALSSIREHFVSERQQHFNNDENHNNTTYDNKSYQLVIKSRCLKKQKYVTHVFHHERNDSQFSIHTQYIKSSLLQLPKYWEKCLYLNNHLTVSIGCYFREPSLKKQTNKIQPSSDILFLRLPDRKLSSETKAEEKQKSSTSSFRFSFQNFPFRLSGNRGIKHSSSEIPTKKKSEQILINHRPRYQSIYESKDEQMGVFILSPRKLSQQQSPKIKNLQQKTIQFEIDDEKYVRGISEEVIEEFVLQPDENLSNVSSDGFQMLQENDELDSVREQASVKNIGLDSRENLKKQQLSMLVRNLESQIIQLLNATEMKQFFYD